MGEERVRYNANLTKASLKVGEARLVAALLLSQPSDEEWRRQVSEVNFLTKRSPETAKTLAPLLRRRLETLSPAAWRLICEGDREEAALIVLAATMADSRLLSDYFDQVLDDLYRVFAAEIPPGAWSRYFEDCAARDENVAGWSSTVAYKLRENTHRILAEAGYLVDTRSRKLVRVMIPNRVENVLEDIGKGNLLRRLRVAAR